MKPERLILRNIRAFADLDIDFRDISACALVGPNGAGKSTITEGILRALYSDGPSILPGSLIRLGADDGAVELEYIHNDQLYKIVRVGGKRSDLQWMVSDGNGGWQPLSGASAKETQEKINASLAMDEDLFLNSCCVMQGKSAGICTAKPAERKAVMYRIYDRELSRFANLHDHAKRRVADLDSQLANGRNTRANLEARITAKPEYEQAKANAEEALQVLGLQLRDAEKALGKLREQAARVQADREKADVLAKAAADLEHECLELRTRIVQRDVTIAECQSVLAQGDIIREQCARATELEAKIEGMAVLYEQYSELGRAFVEATAKRESEVKRLSDDYYHKTLELERAGDTLAAERRRLGAELDGIRKQLEDAERQAALIDEVPCQGATAQACKLLAGAREAKESLGDLRAQVAGIEAQIGEITKGLEENAAESSRTTEEGRIAVEDLRAKLQAEVDEIVAQKDALGYDKDAHQQAVNAFNACKGAREKARELDAAQSRMEVAAAAKAELVTDLAAKEARLAEAKDARDAALGAVGRIDQAALLMAERDLEQVRSQIDDSTRAAAAAVTVLEQIRQAEAELDELAKSLTTTEHQRVVWATLQEAYSRDGIPALIIDAAIPQIEEYANDLLSHLSHGRMSLKFVTQRAVGKGSTAGLAETLDIYVSDGAGERAYEDFSGGEQLRVSLAVRIAIGQVLAQRAGATIRTLLLDEVCSPLDQAGEDALVESIIRLRPMFDCILLVTHREGLRDRLPQQIEVVKGASGSEVRVA